MTAEGDVVVSAEEAEQAGQQLIKERETLTLRIRKLKVDFRRTMSHLALEETSNKQIDFQKQLYNCTCGMIRFVGYRRRSCGRSRTRRRQGTSWLI